MITEHELEQCERANATGRQPVVLVHGATRNRAVPLTYDQAASPSPTL
jgi:hypothetical protein